MDKLQKLAEREGGRMGRQGHLLVLELVCSYSEWILEKTLEEVRHRQGRVRESDEETVLFRPPGLCLKR